MALPLQKDNTSEIMRIDWGDAKLEFPGSVDMDAVFALLRSIQAIYHD